MRWIAVTAAGALFSVLSLDLLNRRWRARAGLVLLALMAIFPRPVADVLVAGARATLRPITHTIEQELQHLPRVTVPSTTPRK